MTPPTGRTIRRYVRGDDLTDGDRWLCNIRQGTFLTENTLDDGFLTTAPVVTYGPNGYGLRQMVGNVREWCAAWFDPACYARSPQLSPTGPASGSHRGMRGGSHLCHAPYRDGCRVAARSANTPESTSGNLGLRCADDAAAHGSR